MKTLSKILILTSIVPILAQAMETGNLHTLCWDFMNKHRGLLKDFENVDCDKFENKKMEYLKTIQDDVKKAESLSQRLKQENSAEQLWENWLTFKNIKESKNVAQIASDLKFPQRVHEFYCESLNKFMNIIKYILDNSDALQSTTFSVSRLAEGEGKEKELYELIEKFGIWHREHRAILTKIQEILETLQ